MKNSHSVIVAAGKGTRLKPLTDNLPKCLVEINGKSILSYQLDAIIENDITDLAIVIGYNGHMIKEKIYSNNYHEKIKVTFIENNNYENTGSCYSLYLCRDYLDGYGYIHTNSDLIFNCNTLKLLLDDENPNSILTMKPLPNNDDMVRFNSDSVGRIVKTGKSEVIDQPDGYLTGPINFSEKGKIVFFTLIENRINQGILDDTCFMQLNTLIKNVQLFSVDCMENKLFEIDTIEDLEFASNQLQ